MATRIEIKPSKHLFTGNLIDGKSYILSVENHNVNKFYWIEPHFKQLLDNMIRDVSLSKVNPLTPSKEATHALLFLAANELVEFTIDGEVFSRIALNANLNANKTRSTKTAGRFNAIAIDKIRNPLKVGLVGEASVLRDSFLNHNIEQRLGSLHVEVRNFFLLGEELRKIFYIGFNNKFAKNLKITRNYLRSVVGGHALETIANTIRCAKAGYDGVVHMCPYGCMPEISMRPILQKVSRDFGIPVLGISLDEHTSAVGIMSRLEAFVDILQNRRTLAAR